MGTIIKGVENPREVLKPGAVIFTEGAIANCFYLVKSGEVDIFKNYGKPDQFHVATISAGRVLGEVSSFDGHPRWATAIAKTETDIVRVAASNLTYQLGLCPPWFRAIILDLVERFRTADDLLVKYGLEAKNATHTVSSLKHTDQDK